MNKVKVQSGFTLIELVVVIVLLGILAATAAPKFIDLQDDARTATLQGVKASMESASALVHGKSLIAGNESIDGDATTAPTVVVNGTTIEISFGYPRSNDTDAQDIWVNELIDLDVNAFDISIVSGTVVVVPEGMTAPTTIPASPFDATATDNCFAFFTEAADATTPPVIASVECL